MKAVVAGSRDYHLSVADYQFLEHAVQMHRVTEIYTDGTPGVAELVEAWANRRAIPVHRITANFMHDGPATFEERNTSLVALARVVIAFAGGTTDDLIAKARKTRRLVIESPDRQLANVPSIDTRHRQLQSPPPRPGRQP